MLPASRVKNLATEGITNSNVLDIRYKKKDGEIVRRTIEPYEVRTEQVVDDYGYLKNVTFLYGYDISPSVKVEHRHIKRWIVDHFLFLRVMKNRRFNPRRF